MTMFKVTAIYAGLLALMMVFLAAQVVRLRGKHRVTLQDGGNPDLMLGIRVFGNFAEYVPMALVLMMLAESAGTPSWAVHGLGVALIVGRVAHALGLRHDRGTTPGRLVGMNLTWGVIVSAGLAAMFWSLA